MTRKHTSNRRERRAAKKLGAATLTTMSWGGLAPDHEQYGSSVYCYVCGVVHEALNFAIIEENQSTICVALCKPCFEAHDSDAVMRRYWGNPDLKITEGGEATPEQLQALVDKHNADETEH